MKKSTLIELIYELQQLHERKDGLSDYDFVKNRAMNSLLKTSKRKREDINWVGSWVVTREPEHSPQRLTNLHSFEICARLSRQSVML